MLELIGQGPFTIVGTLCGLLAAFLIHKFVPVLAEATYLLAGLVAAGFIGGLAIDMCSKKNSK